MQAFPNFALVVGPLLALNCLPGPEIVRAESKPPKAAAVPAPPSAAAPAPAITAQATLRMARERLSDPKSVQSIKSRIVERLTIGGRNLHLEGAYVQGTELKLRLEFKTAAENAANAPQGSFLEICDGTILWTRYEIGKQSHVTRRNVRQILNSGGDSNLLTVELGLGGLPALLASLERSMKFDSLFRQEIGGREFVMIAGTWTEDALKKFKHAPGKKSLPDHIPDAVRVYFEPDLLFPRRIAFLKQDAAEPVAEIDFLDVVINAPIDERAFAFVPPEHLRTVDVTNQYLEQLKAAPPK